MFLWSSGKGFGMIKKILGILCLIPMVVIVLGFIVICGYAVYQHIISLKLYPTLIAASVLTAFVFVAWGCVMLYRLGIKLIQNQQEKI
jgi:hypothetical protein